MFGFELVAAILVMAVALAICALSWLVPLSLAPHFWASAGAFPFVTGAIILVLALAWTLDLLQNRPRQHNPGQPGPALESRLVQIIGPKDRQKRLFTIAAATVIFVFILIPLFGIVSHEYGFVGATFTFILVMLKVFSRLSATRLVLIAASTAVIVYVIFTYGLLLPMPR